ncbi:DUF4433 domain-containing protein [Colwellia sp. BRX10-3]|uniref:DUF4433 domain-containing protein n=1 Tax=Colwellia sp. BRX10-3 TaxID=2759844 RepID=UPI0015F3692D|nr:DUF4433 domain-containing protein [Colwellia sp. BRX10-3]MBA6390485.1 DUF4433 domain-containing protein [Colwellia sp. BRX10-3]
MTYNFSHLATVDHMTHISNLEGILANGLLSHNNPYQKVDISNEAVNRRRSSREPIYNKSLHDYVPFYFNPRNAMLYRNQQCFSNGLIIVLGFNTKIISTPGAVFTNGNAARSDTCFSSEKTFLETLNWDKVFSPRWVNYGQHDESIKTAMMSELLIHGGVSIDDLEVIFCATNESKQYIEKNMNIANVSVEVCPQLFF